MMKRSVRSLLALAIAFTAFAPTARAESMVTRLPTVLSMPNIVIGVYREPRQLTIKRALRGNLAGTVTVLPGDGEPNIASDSSIVAFLDGSLHFRFVAMLPPTGDPAVAPLRLRGFYDFNAHHVTPGVLTLQALEALLRGEHPTLRFTGPLLALSPNGREIITTNIKLDVQVAEDGKARVSGLPSTAGLPQPVVHSGAAFHDMRVDWNTGYPRPFQLEGVLERVDASGAIVTRFHAVMPEHLFREADLRAYLANAKLAYPYWPLEVRFDDGTRWQGSIGDDYNSSATFRDAKGREHRWSSYAVREGRYFEFSDEKWELDPPSAGALIDTYGESRVLLQELHRGPLGFRISKGPRAGLRGTIHLGTLQLRPAIGAK